MGSRVKDCIVEYSRGKITLLGAAAKSQAPPLSSLEANGALGMLAAAAAQAIGKSPRLQQGRPTRDFITQGTMTSRLGGTTHTLPPVGARHTTPLRIRLDLFVFLKWQTNSIRPLGAFMPLCPSVFCLVVFFFKREQENSPSLPTAKLPSCHLEAFIPSTERLWSAATEEARRTIWLNCFDPGQVHSHGKARDSASNASASIAWNGLKVSPTQRERESSKRNFENQETGQFAVGVLWSLTLWINKVESRLPAGKKCKCTIWLF